MKRVTLASVVLAVLLAPAVAADLRVKAPILKAPPPWSWTGCYIGVNAGHAWENLNNSLTVTNGTPGYFNVGAIDGVNASGSGKLNSSGFTGGGQIGCNYQTGSFVFGAETDFDWLSQGQSFGGTFLFTTNNAPYNLTVDEHKDWLYTLRGRVGYAADRVLFFATGGIAVVGLRFNQAFSQPPFTTPPNGTPEAASISQAVSGLTVGGGVEDVVTNNWTVKAEYLYSRFSPGSASGTFSGLHNGIIAGATATITNSLSDLTIQEFRVGANYKFGGM